MKKLYTHENRMIIFNLKNLLEKEGIGVVIMNEFASGGAGDLATFDTWPELWVEHEAQFKRAESVLNNVVFNSTDDYWYCRGCQEKNNVSFELCWNCGRACDEKSEGE